MLGSYEEGIVKQAREKTLRTLHVSTTKVTQRQKNTVVISFKIDD